MVTCINSRPMMSPLFAMSRRRRAADREFTLRQSIYTSVFYSPMQSASTMLPCARSEQRFSKTLDSAEPRRGDGVLNSAGRPGCRIGVAICPPYSQAISIQRK
jgi:hypothetical protein